MTRKFTTYLYFYYCLVCFYYYLCSTKSKSGNICRQGHSDPNRVSVLSNRILVFRVYQNQSHSGYMKIWLMTGLGPIVLSDSSPNRFFGLKLFDLYLFCNQNISKINSKIRKKHQTCSFKIKRKVNTVIDKRKTK